MWHGHYHSFYRQLLELSTGDLVITGLDCDQSDSYELSIEAIDLRSLAASLSHYLF